MKSTRLRHGWLASASVIILVLSGCSGADTASPIAVTPAPSPAPTPSPTPTPVPTPSPTPSPTPTAIAWTAALAASGDTPIARGTAPAPGGGFYVVGSFRPGSALSIGGTTVSSVGQEDIFVARVTASGTLMWLNRYGGAAGDYAFDVDSDAAGNAYVAGRAAGTVAFGSTTIDAGDGDAVLFKVAPDGTVLWVRQTAGAGGSAGNEVATDAAGNSAMIGPAAGPLDLGGGIVTSGPASGTDPFVAYYGPDGTPKWGKVLAGSDAGSSTTEAARGVTITPTGKVVMTGPFTGTIAAPGGPTLSSGSASNTDCYLLSFSASGALDFSRSLGGTSADICRGVGGDSTGGIIVGGTFQGTIFTGANQLTSAGAEDIFVVSYAADGSIRWSRRIGGTGGEEGAEVQMLGDDAFVFGNFFGTITLPGGNVVASAGARDNLLLRFAPDGTQRGSLTALGGGDDIAFALAVQADGSFTVVGTYSPPSIAFGSTVLPATAQSSFIGIGR